MAKKANPPGGHATKAWESDELIGGEAEALGQVGTQYVMAASGELRLQFIRKVYAVLVSQLLLTVFISLPMMLHDGIRAFVQATPGL